MMERMIVLNRWKDDRIALTVKWLQMKVKHANAAGLVVGISGGIDSAVVANLIKLACPDQSAGLILPVNSHKNDLHDALAAAQAAGLTHHIIDFTEIHQSIMQKVMGVLDPHYKEKDIKRQICDANLRARLRMCALYAYANALNYLVVGTDNAAELYTGYFTKHGDGGVDLLPIGKLLKKEVYQWAVEFNVPERILQRPPSAGLWEGQTDEEEMGTTYEIIDQFLSGNTVPEKELSHLNLLHERSNHKRQMPPLPDW